jgi:hypothetical protein
VAPRANGVRGHLAFRQRITAQSHLATAVSIAWWCLFDQLTLASGNQDFIFGRRPFDSGYYPGTLSSRIEFARSFVISAAAYFGILGGELAARWSPEQRAFDWRPRGKRSDLWVLWVVLYSIPIMVLGGGYILAALQLATGVACILLCLPLTRRAPVSRKSALRDSVVAGVFISLIACVLLLPGGFLAFYRSHSSGWDLCGDGFPVECCGVSFNSQALPPLPSSFRDPGIMRKLRIPTWLPIPTALVVLCAFVFAAVAQNQSEKASD